LEQRLRETQCVTLTLLQKLGRPQTVRTPARKDATIAAVERDKLMGSCDIARELGMS